MTLTLTLFDALERTADLGSLTVRDCNGFILRYGRNVSWRTSKMSATALRSFLRHLHQEGEIPADLVDGILPAMRRRQPELPRSLDPDEVEALLDGCDRTTAVGRRDHAILLLLSRLGLRAGEVVAMTLDDLDWNNGLVRVCGKGRHEQLPLPHDVGEALAAWLRDGRPSCSTRRLFVRAHAPHKPFSGVSAVSCLVQRALARAELDPPFKGAHMLRHSLATGMLRNGASLEDIGQILRHRHPVATALARRCTVWCSSKHRYSALKVERLTKSPRQGYSECNRTIQFDRLMICVPKKSLRGRLRLLQIQLMRVHA